MTHKHHILSGPEKIFVSAPIALGKAIRRLRKERGLSQEKLADTASIDRGYIGAVERGETNAALINIIKIANALGVSVADLMAEAKI